MSLRFILRSAAGCALATLISNAPAAAGELFYMDRDSFNNQYTGPVGPLVLSGEIVPGDYAKLLAKIAEDPERFLERNKLFLASSDGNAAEAIKIARLLRGLYTEVIVGPLTGRCVGACFLIYASASARGTDSDNLLGIHRVGLAESEWVSRSTSEAALIEDSLQTPVRDFLTENEIPSELVDELFKHLPTDVYWLTEHDEQVLGVKSAAFQRFLANNCAWDDALEKAVFRGERLEDMKALSACRIRVTLPAARKALAQALKQKALEEKAPEGKLPAAKAPAAKALEAKAPAAKALEAKAPAAKAPAAKAPAAKALEAKALEGNAAPPKPRPDASADAAARTSGQMSPVAP